MSHKIPTYLRKTQANKIHNNKYDYSLWQEDVTLSTIVEIICPFHGVFKQTLKNHIVGKHGCRKCHDEKLGVGRKKTKKFFIDKANKIHNNKYDYSLWPESPKTTDKVKVLCTTHGYFLQRLNKHLSGDGCPLCKNEKISLVHKKTKKFFIDKANKIHNNKYDYSLWPESPKTTDKIKIICPTHGEFEQKLNSHLNGQGCSKCKLRKTIDTNNKKYKRSHYNQQHLSKNTIDKLTNKNWLIEQHYYRQKTLTQISHELSTSDVTVGRYLQNHNLKTQHYFQSVGETQLNEFIQSLDIATETNVRTLIPPYEIDVYVPTHNIAFEYCGLYWHSEQRGKDKHYHKKKHDLCKEKGIQLITIFEDEWLYRQKQVKSKLKSLLGRDDRQRVYARQTKIKIIDTKTKQSFFESNHIQGNGRGSINIGLLYDEQLVACMSFIKQKNNTFVLNRYATSACVIGGFSKLLKYFQQNYQWNQIISFADLRWSDGNLYKRTGWKLDSILRPDYYYSLDGNHRFHKFNFRRKKLPKLLKCFNPSLSEKQNCDRNGVLRMWDCGKMRFIVDSSSTV